MAAACMQPAGRGYRRAKLSASGLRFGLGPEHHDAVGARLRRPDLALAPQHLPHGGIPAVAREAFETLGLRIEAQHRVGAEVGDPDLVGLVDIDRVRTRLVAGEFPGLPVAGRRFVAAELARTPFADPQPSVAVRPDAPCALPRRRWPDDRRLAAFRIDARDVVAGERGVPDLA